MVKRPLGRPVSLPRLLLRLTTDLWMTAVTMPCCLASLTACGLLVDLARSIIGISLGMKPRQLPCTKNSSRKSSSVWKGYVNMPLMLIWLDLNVVWLLIGQIPRPPPRPPTPEVPDVPPPQLPPPMTPNGVALPEPLPTPPPIETLPPAEPEPEPQTEPQLPPAVAPEAEQQNPEEPEPEPSLPIRQRTIPVDEIPAAPVVRQYLSVIWLLPDSDDEDSNNTDEPMMQEELVPLPEPLPEPLEIPPQPVEPVEAPVAPEPPSPAIQIKMELPPEEDPIVLQPPSPKRPRREPAVKPLYVPGDIIDVEDASGTWWLGIVVALDAEALNAKVCLSHWFV